MVSQKDALLPIHEIEDIERKKMLDLEQENDLDLMQWWQAKFPEVPARIFRIMKEEHDYCKGSLPWNRRTRRRLLRSSKVVLRLCAGEKAKEWKELES